MIIYFLLWVGAGMVIAHHYDRHWMMVLYGALVGPIVGLLCFYVWCFIVFALLIIQSLYNLL